MKDFSKSLSADFNIENLGSLIRSKRKECGYTQAEMAECIGITAQHYSRIERGEYIPSLQTFISLIGILKFNITDLELKNTKNITSTMYEIMHLLEKFNNTQQKAVLSFLKTMEPVKA